MRCIIYFLLVSLMFVSCENDSENNEPVSLATYVSNAKFEIGAVIACAASEQTTGNILTFFYPEANATNFRLYETNNVDLDNSDFKAYTQVFLESEAIFNGYLRRFSQEALTEKWIIVTFELDNEIKISNPIRSKQLSKLTLWEDIVDIDQSESGMPIFSWEDNFVGDNAIYFQILSDNQNNLLSGTYTNENTFQYYKLDNVVLNITTEQPPELIKGLSYNFTLMDVSEDNWVNTVTLNKLFIVE